MKRKRPPLASLLPSAHILPPCASTMCLQIASPRPVPSLPASMKSTVPGSTQVSGEVLTVPRQDPSLIVYTVGFNNVPAVALILIVLPFTTVYWYQTFPSTEQSFVTGFAATGGMQTNPGAGSITDNGGSLGAVHKVSSFH